MQLLPLSLSLTLGLEAIRCRRHISGGNTGGCGWKATLRVRPRVIVHSNRNPHFYRPASLELQEVLNAKVIS